MEDVISQNYQLQCGLDSFQSLGNEDEKAIIKVAKVLKTEIMNLTPQML